MKTIAIALALGLAAALPAHADSVSIDTAHARIVLTDGEREVIRDYYSREYSPHCRHRRTHRRSGIAMNYRNHGSAKPRYRAIALPRRHVIANRYCDSHRLNLDIEIHRSLACQLDYRPNRADCRRLPCAGRDL